MSNQQRKPNTGVLFPNKSDNPKAPANKGSFSVSGEVLDALNRGESVDFAVWNQVSREGEKYGSVKISLPYKKREAVDEAF